MHPVIARGRHAEDLARPPARNCERVVTRKRFSGRRRPPAQPIGKVVGAHDEDAVAAMGLVVPEREAEHGRHPAADEAMQRGIAARAAQMLQAVGPVLHLHEIRARLTLNERADEEPACV